MTQKRNFQVFCIPTEELMDDPDKDSHVVIPNVDEAKVFGGKTMEALSKSELQQAIGTICERANRRFDSGK